MAFHGESQEQLNCPKHPFASWRHGVCPLCLRDRLVTLCPNCARPRPCRCPASPPPSEAAMHPALSSSSFTANGGHRGADPNLQRSRSTALPRMVAGKDSLGGGAGGGRSDGVCHGPSTEPSRRRKKSFFWSLFRSSKNKGEELEDAAGACSGITRSMSVGVTEAAASGDGEVHRSKGKGWTGWSFSGRGQQKSSKVVQDRASWYKR